MKRIGTLGAVLALAATLTIGCGGGGGEIIRLITQGDAETCLTEGTFLLLVLSQKLDDVLDEIEGDDQPDVTVTETSEDVWSFDCSLALMGIGAPDTRITGTIVLTDGVIEPGASLEVNDVVISSLGGPITGNADVDVDLGEDTVTMTGFVNIHNESSDCDIMLTMPSGFTLGPSINIFEERQLAAELGIVVIAGVLGFDFDFGPGPNLTGTMTVPQEGQEATVSTELIGDFTFKIFPETAVLAALIPCLFDLTDTTDYLVEGLEAVIDEATGEAQSDDVEINGSNFTYDDGDLTITGSISLSPLSVTFAFDNEGDVTGQSDGPILIGLPAQGTGTVNGDVIMNVVDTPCTARFSFINTQFDAEQFEDFVGGRTLLVATVGDDSIELDINEGVEGDDSELELAGVTVRLNGVVLPPIAIIYLVFGFGEVD